MVEIFRNSNKKGFFVKMRFMNHREEMNFCFRYCRWVLWVSLSLYLFTSFLIGHNQNHERSPSSLDKIRVNNLDALASRAVVESTDHMESNRDKLKDLKVFIYDLPPKYNADWLSDDRCSNHLFASEVAIHRALLSSGVRTFNPYEADIFFVPVYVSCNFSSVNGFPAIGHARSLLASAVDHISSEYTFWNRSRGSDHVFVASHDYGACFHAMEDVARANGIPMFLKNSIVLQTFGVKYWHPCQDVENILIPPYVSPESVRATLVDYPIDDRRDIFAFFRGKMEVNPKNVSGRFYGRRVRTAIWKNYSGDRRFYLKRHKFAGYQSEIARSIFCLCPLGWAPWSPRLVESVALGCVPVIIADGIRLPFPDVVKWPEISLTVAEKDVGKLGKILERVAATNLTEIQNNLWDPTNRRALLFNQQIQQQDATWQVLSALIQKLDRSYRVSRVSNQLNDDT